MAQARVEIVFSERREGASVSRQMLRDLEELKRSQNGLKGLKPLTPKVDSSELHDLNDLLDVKQRHIQETAQIAASNPLIIQTRMAGFDEVMRQIEQLKREKEAAAAAGGASGGSPSNIPSPVAGVIELLAEAIKAAVETGFQLPGKLLGGLLSPIQSVLGGILTGATEGIGRELSRGVGVGITEGATQALSPIFGTAESIARTLSKGTALEITSSLSGDKEFKFIADTIEAVVGKSEILTSSGAAEAKRTAKEADSRVQAQTFFERQADSIAPKEIKQAERDLLKAQEDVAAARRREKEELDKNIAAIAKRRGIQEKTSARIDAEAKANAERLSQIDKARATSDSQIADLQGQRDLIAPDDFDAIDRIDRELETLFDRLSAADKEAERLVSRQDELRQISRDLRDSPLASQALLSTPLADAATQVGELGGRLNSRFDERAGLQSSSLSSSPEERNAIEQQLRVLDAEIAKDQAEFQRAVSKQQKLAQEMDGLGREVASITELAQKNVAAVSEDLKIAEERALQVEARLKALRLPREAGQVIGSSFNTVDDQVAKSNNQITARRAAIAEIRQEGAAAAKRQKELISSASNDSLPEQSRRAAAVEAAGIKAEQAQRIAFIGKLEEEILSLGKAIDSARLELLASPQVKAEKDAFTKEKATQALPGLGKRIDFLDKKISASEKTVEALSKKSGDAADLIAGIGKRNTVDGVALPASQVPEADRKALARLLELKREYDDEIIVRRDGIKDAKEELVEKRQQLIAYRKLSADLANATGKGLFGESRPKKEPSLKTTQAEDIFNFVLDRVAEASGVKLDQKRLPTLQADDKLDPNTLGEYSRKTNSVRVRQEVIDQLNTSESFDDISQIVDTFLHELRHAVQFEFGALSPAEAVRSAKLISNATPEEAKGIAPLVESSTRAVASDPAVQRGARALEADAYLFAARNLDETAKEAEALLAKRKFEDQFGFSGGEGLRTLQGRIAGAEASVEKVASVAPIPVRNEANNALQEIRDEAAALDDLIVKASRLGELTAGEVSELGAELTAQLSISFATLDRLVAEFRQDTIQLARDTKERRDSSLGKLSKKEIQALALASGVDDPKSKSRKQLSETIRSTPIAQNFSAFRDIEQARAARLAERRARVEAVAAVSTKAGDFSAAVDNAANRVLYETLSAGRSLAQIAAKQELVQRSMAGFAAASETAGNLLAARVEQGGRALLSGSTQAAGGLVRVYRAAETFEAALLGVNPLFLGLKALGKNVLLPAAGLAAAAQVPVLGPAIQSANSFISSGVAGNLSGFLGYAPEVATQAVGGGLLGGFQAAITGGLSGLEGQVIQGISAAVAPLVTGNLALGSIEASLKLTGDRIVAASDAIAANQKALPPTQKDRLALPEANKVTIAEPVKIEQPIKVEQKELIAVDANGQEVPRNSSNATKASPAIKAKPVKELAASRPALDISIDPRQVIEDETARLKYLSESSKVAKTFEASRPRDRRSERNDAELLAEALDNINRAIKSLTPEERTKDEGAALARLKGQAVRLQKAAESRKAQPFKVEGGAATAAQVAGEIERLGALFRDQLKGSIPGNDAATKEVQTKVAIALTNEVATARKLLDQLQQKGRDLATNSAERTKIDKAAKSARSNVTRSGNDAAKVVEEAKDAGIDTANGFSSGLEQGIQRATNVAAYLAKKTVNELEDELEIRSPSRVTERIGALTAEGFILGLGSLRRLNLATLLRPVLAQAEDLAQSTVQRIESQLSKISPDRLLAAAKSPQGRAIVKDLAVNTAGLGASIAAKSAGGDAVGGLAGDLVGALAARLAIVTGEAIADGYRQLKGTEEFEGATQIERAAQLMAAAAKSFSAAASDIGKDLTGDIAGFASGNLISQLAGVPLSGAVGAAAVVPKIQGFRDKFSGAGDNFSRSFSSELSDGEDDADRAARGLGQAAIEGLEGELQIASPSRRAIEIGQRFVQGFEIAVGGLKRLNIAGLLGAPLAAVEAQILATSAKLKALIEDVRRGFGSGIQLGGFTPGGRGGDLPGSTPEAGSKSRSLVAAERLAAIEADVARQQAKTAAELATKASQIEREIAASPREAPSAQLQVPAATTRQTAQIETKQAIQRQKQTDDLDPVSLNTYENFLRKSEDIEARLNDADDRLNASINRLVDPPNADASVGDRLRRVLESNFDTQKLAFDLKNIAAAAVGFYGLDSVFDSVKQKLGEVFRGFVELDRQLKTFDVVAGGSAQDLAQVRLEVERLAVSSPKTSKEIASAAVELAKAGFNAKQVAGVLPAVVNSSVASGESLQRTGEVIGAALGQFGLFSSETEVTQRNAARVADLLTAASNASATGVDELGESLKYTASQSKLANQSEKETITSLALLSAAGVKGSAAGTGLAEALRRVSIVSASASTELDNLRSRGSKNAIAAFNRLGIEVRDANGFMLPLSEIIPKIKGGLDGFAKGDQELILNALFGVQGGASVGKLLNLTNDQVTQITGQMDGFAGSVDRAAIAMQGGLSGAVDLFSSSAEAAGEQLISIAQVGIEPVIRGVTSLLNVFLSIPAPLKSVVLGMAALSATTTLLIGGITAYNLLNGQLIIREGLAAAAFLRRAATTQLAANATAGLVAVNSLMAKDLLALGGTGAIAFFGKLASGAKGAAIALSTLSVGQVFAGAKTVVSDFAGGLSGAVKTAESFADLELIPDSKARAAGTALNNLKGAAAGVGVAIAAWAVFSSFDAIRSGGQVAREELKTLEKTYEEFETKLAEQRNRRGAKPEGGKDVDPLVEARKNLNLFGKVVDTAVLNPLNAADDAIRNFNKDWGLGFVLGAPEKEVATFAEASFRGQIQAQSDQLLAAQKFVDKYEAILSDPTSTPEDRQIAIGAIEQSIASLSREKGATDQLEASRLGTIKTLGVYANALENVGKKALDTGKSLAQVGTEDLQLQRKSSVDAAIAAERDALIGLTRQEQAGKVDKDQIEAGKLAATQARIKAEQIAEQKLLDGLNKKGASSDPAEEEKRIAAIAESTDKIIDLRTQAADTELQISNQKEQAFLNQTQKRAEEELRIISSGFADKDLAIAQGLEKNLISQEQADAQSLKLAQDKIAAEIELERERIQSLKSKGPLTGEEETSRVEAIQAAEAKITELQTQASKDRLAAREESEQKVLAQISERAQKELDAITSTESRKQLEIARLEEQGLITKEEVEKRKVEASIVSADSQLLAERARLEKLSSVKLTGDREKERLDQVRESQEKIIALELQGIEARENAGKAAIARIQKVQDDQVESLTSAETQKQLEIARLEESGVITKEEAERRKEAAAFSRVAGEIQAERDKLAQLNAEAGLSGGAEEARVEAIASAQEKITQLELQQVEKRKALRAAEEASRIAVLKDSQEKALQVLESAEQERLILQQRLINRSRADGVSEVEIAKISADGELQARRKGAEQKLAAEQDYLAKLQALPQPNDPETARQRESEIQAARKGTSALVLELLKIEEEEQKRVQQAAIDQINIRRGELESLKAIATSSVSNEQSLISARQRLSQSQAALDENQIQKRIDAATTEEEKQRLQITLEQQRANAVAVRLELERQAFALSQQKALLDAEIEVAERRIAVEEAIANGETERQIELKRQLLGLAQEQLGVLGDVQKLEAQALSNEQKLAKQQAADAIQAAQEAKSLAKPQAAVEPQAERKAKGKRGDDSDPTTDKAVRGDSTTRKSPLRGTTRRGVKTEKTSEPRDSVEERQRRAQGFNPGESVEEFLKRQKEATRGSLQSSSQKVTPQSPSTAGENRQSANSLLAALRSQVLKVDIVSSKVAMGSGGAKGSAFAPYSVTPAPTGKVLGPTSTTPATAPKALGSASTTPAPDKTDKLAKPVKDLGDAAKKLSKIVGNVVLLPKPKALFTGGSAKAGTIASVAERGPELVIGTGGQQTLVQSPGLFQFVHDAKVLNASETQVAISNQTNGHRPHATLEREVGIGRHYYAAYTPSVQQGHIAVTNHPPGEADHSDALDRMYLLLSKKLGILEQTLRHIAGAGSKTVAGLKSLPRAMGADIYATAAHSTRIDGAS